MGMVRKYAGVALVCTTVLFNTANPALADVSVEEIDTGDIVLVRVRVRPDEKDRVTADNVGVALAERRAIDELTGTKVYFSEADRIYDELKEKHTIEEVEKDGKKYWKCTPKNPKTITVKKARDKEYIDADGTLVHFREYYEEEIPNPEYLTEEEVEKKTIWYEVKKKSASEKEKEEKNGEEESLSGTTKPHREGIGSVLGRILGF